MTTGGDKPHQARIESRYAKLIAACSERDFDGHTDFGVLSPEQRLEWLAAAVRFMHELRSTPNESGFTVLPLEPPV